MKKKFLAVVSSVFAITLLTGGALVQTEAKAETLLADAQYMEMQMDGASVRLAYDENGAPTGDTGIRFTAVAKSAIAGLEGLTEVGVMIVPAQALTAFNAQKESGTSDYFAYFTSKNVSKESIAYSVTPDRLNAEEDTNVRVSIVELDNYDFNVKYQAVGYYQVGESYYYTQESQVRSVAEVANNALLSTTFTGDRNAAASIVKKAINVAQGETVTVGTYATKDFSETLTAIGLDETAVEAAGFEFSMATSNAFSIDGSVVTAKSTSETAAVSTTAYGGALNFDFAVKAKAERGFETTIHSSSKTSYTAYGATVEATETTAQFTNLPAITGVTLAAGTLNAENGDIQKVSGTDLSYVAFTRNDEYNSFQSTVGKYNTYVAVVEFTGNNMPIVGFFAPDHSEETPMENVVNRKGIIMTNGFGGFNSNVNSTVVTGFQSNLKVAGYNSFATDFGAKTASNEEGGSHLYGEANFAGSYVKLKNADQAQRYRLFVCLYAYLKSGTAGSDDAVYATKVQISLYTINKDDGKNDQVLYECSESRGYPWDKDNFKGNIVFYGRPGEETKLDRIHFAQSTGGVSKSVAKFA